MLNIQENILLARYTTFKIGGPAKFFVEAGNGEELAEAIEYAKNNNLKFFILGGGSNVLVSDHGFDGLVIKMNSDLFVSHENSLGCGAGLLLSRAVKESLDRGLAGLEWAVGIPGTVGGAVRGNAGAFGGEMADIVENVNFIDMEDSYEADGKVKIKTFNNQECGFGYRDSIFKQNSKLLILSVVINLRTGKKDESAKIIKEIIGKRNSAYPQESGSAGSFFKNPEANEKLKSEFESETGTACRNNKIPARWLIEKTGLLGKKMGGAMVSEKHGNFIVNAENATAQDIVMLSGFVKQQVRDKFGVELQEEIQYVGF